MILGHREGIGSGKSLREEEDEEGKDQEKKEKDDERN